MTKYYIIVKTKIKSKENVMSENSLFSASNNLFLFIFYLN